MGLDLLFSASKAKEAGIKLSTVPNGTEEEIAAAICEEESADYDNAYSLDYLDWLRSESTVLEVPNADHLVNVYIDDDVMQVRANKWGSTYAPLTDWLIEHNITWEEV